VKQVRFPGDSRRCLAEFPEKARNLAGRQLFAIQSGLSPSDSKHLSSLGAGVEELRVWDGSGTYRIVYVARFEEAVYVLHAFQKKTQETSKRDVEIVQRRWAEMRRIRGQV
jgi:phage-related protein